MSLRRCVHPLRIANIIEEGRWGGPQKRIAMVAAALRERNIRTTVLLPKRDSAQFKDTLNNIGIPWEALPLHRLGRKKSTLFLYILAFPIDIFRIWRILRQGSYDLIHVSGGAWQIKGPIAGRLAKVPVIWHLNDTQMPKMLVALFRRLGLIADAFFVAAQKVEQYYIVNTPLESIPTYFVPAPVATVEFIPHMINSDFEIDAMHFPRIVAVANINPIKGIEVLIKAVDILRRRQEEFSVSIAGAIYQNQELYFSELKKLISSLRLENKIKFLGGQGHVAAALKSADIFVCSSLAEASPMAVWEAMSMGCAIVSTDVGDVARYIENGVNGYIVPVCDAEAMADAIYKLASDSELRGEMGRRAREVACRELDIGVVADKTASAYLSVYNSREKCNTFLE